ncbi:Ethylene-overproduction protein 1 [Sesamum angolense]|uniref:Ethylene-overproduction protein 1 n=1 Tax=Sesamum angolense TaxID=2727404 RepID=A0AAE1WFJ4_9LAMI|nr:Ethylene-overproduction protein 1 [Sesamum angolense]
MQQHIFNTMRSLKMIDGCKGNQVYAVNPTASGGGGGGGGAGGGAAGGGVGEKFFQHLQDHLRVNSIRRISSTQIDPCLKSVDFVATLADVYRRLENCPESERSGVYMEQCAIFRGLPDPKLFRRCLRSARQHAVDVHSKVVLSAWLRFERREDELFGVSAMNCSGWSMECPKSSLVSGYNPESESDICLCHRGPEEGVGVEPGVRGQECSTSISHGDDEDDDCDMFFVLGTMRSNAIGIRLLHSLDHSNQCCMVASWNRGRREYISPEWISAKAMRAAEVFSRTKSVDSFDPNIVFELLILANRFCCDEMKSACDSYLASLVDDMDSAVLLIEYGLAETAYLLVAACLQVFLRELPNSMHNQNVMKLFCSSEAREKLASVGHASFLLYSFLSQIAMEEDMKSNTTVMLLERMVECATEDWQKQLALHQLGCVMLERKEYKDAQKWFESAVQAGHVYSLVGVARATNKRGHKYKAYKLMNSLVSEYTPSGWMYQERALYSSGKELMMDLNSATEMDPTLSYPYKYRAISLMEEHKIGAAISEINKIIGFKVSPDCLELRAWFLIAMEDYEGALTDVRALLTLDPHYMMFHGKLHGDQLVELLRHNVQQCSQADCWMQLYDRWSSVDDIGSLAVVHHMLANDPGKSLLRFRQSLLLLR